MHFTVLLSHINFEITIGTGNSMRAGRKFYGFTHD